MARVIKAGAGHKAARPVPRVHVDAGPNKVIARDVYQAKQDAEHILMRAEQERQGILTEGKKRAARSREEAMARGASEAFAAAAEALTAFRKRAERYAQASDDVRVLALEVVKKILGCAPDVGPLMVDKILQRGMAQLRARRRLRLQVSHGRLKELSSERPNLMKALQSEPDLVVEGVDDVGEGFARVVSEIGGALCAEDAALDALSMAVNVREQPRERAGRHAARGSVGTSPGSTAVGEGPPGLSELRAEAGDQSVRDAAVVRDERVDDNKTANVPALKRRVSRTSDEVDLIEAKEESGPTKLPHGRIGVPRPAPRAALRSVQGSAEDGDATMRQVPLMPLVGQGLRPDDDDDLDLFTDDAPRKRR